MKQDEDRFTLELIEPAPAAAPVPKRGRGRPRKDNALTPAQRAKRYRDGRRWVKVAVLFARADSIYKQLPGVDAWDIERDARRWPGGAPVVAHPPCRGWGRLRALANPRHDEKALATWAVARVRENCGVLEHPAGSTLWPAAGLPEPGRRDEFGGWTLPISQSWWDHRAEKLTWLYIVGCAPAQIPDIPLKLGTATHVICSSGRRKDGSRLRRGDAGWRPECTKAEREHTPPALAAWLVELARRCRS